MSCFTYSYAGVRKFCGELTIYYFVVLIFGPLLYASALERAQRLPLAADQDLLVEAQPLINLGLLWISSCEQIRPCSIWPQVADPCLR